MRNPLGSTGFVICDDAEGKPQFIGTCFAYRVHGWMVTAAHNVRGILADRLSVSIYLEDVERGLGVQEVQLHPQADIALLKVDDPFPDLRIFDPFRDIAVAYETGEGVSAFGYPSQIMAVGQKAIPRFFRGNIQRQFLHESPFGYKYIAIEVSFGSPAGLSGGPVSLDRDFSSVIGLMAENYRADTFVHTIEEVVKGDSTYRDTQHDFINYGIAVRLSDHQQWIDERCR